MTPDRSLEQRLLDSAPDALIVVDADGMITFANAQACVLFDYAHEELLGLGVEKLVPGPLRTAHEAHRETFGRSPSLRPMGQGRALQGRRRDGTHFHAEVSLSPLEIAGGATLTAAAIRDVSERVRLQEEAAAQLELFRAVFEQAAIGIALVDLEGRPLEANPALCEMLGYSAEQLARMHFVEFTHPDDADKDLEQYRELLAGTRSSYSMEKRYIRADGEIVRARLRASMLRNENGSPRLGVGLVEDITQQAALREQLELSQRMEAMGRLAGGIAHDFNNYLTAISGYAQLALRSLPEEHSVAPDIREIVKAANTSAGLVRQVLAFSRNQMFERHPLDVNELIEGSMPLFRPLVSERVTLELELAPGIGSTAADRHQLEQVLMNLLVNASDAIPHGGTVKLRTRSARIEAEEGALLGGLRPGEYVVVEVEDDGVGIAADIREHIFDPFFTTKEVGHGTGLGLATVYGIVQQHGGAIQVESEAGAGSTFGVYLPRIEGQPSDAEPAPTSEEHDPGTGTILAVEDEPEVLELLVRALRHLGYRTLAAANPHDALDLMERLGDRVDLVVTDVMMPGMTGVEMVERLHADRPELPVLYLSGYSGNALARHFASGQAPPRLQKPFALADLADAVHKALNGDA